MSAGGAHRHAAATAAGFCRRVVGTCALVLVLVATGAAHGAGKCHRTIIERDPVCSCGERKRGLLTLAEAAVRVGVTEDELRTEIRDGRLLAVERDGVLLVSLTELDRWQEEQHAQIAENSGTRKKEKKTEEDGKGVKREEKKRSGTRGAGIDTRGAGGTFANVSAAVAPVDANGNELEELSKKQAAAWLGITVRTLDNWRHDDPELDALFHRPLHLRRGTVRVTFADLRAWWRKAQAET